MSTGGTPPSSDCPIDDSPNTTPSPDSSAVHPSPHSTSTNTTPSSQLPNSKHPLEDPAHPYYLHHGDNPDNILVTQLLTGQDNYPLWSRAMRLAISIKNKIGFLDGSITKPSISDTFLYNAWFRNNNIVISWILNSVSKEISTSILYDESAFEIWTDLWIRFQ
ncbi:uncharacterized protein LOC133815354 [Humulus lupulus]|uniref:uncharacterized protein LOC133815354 n=1 Tax=Humulus lupulus TaxID=3486 RepID=UPI002B407B09|nr:uncharacterized protein LOC133815354 [Humulus lupulus]